MHSYNLFKIDAIMQWSLWGACSVICGNGSRARKRPRCKQVATFKRLCKGFYTQSEDCQSGSCSGSQGIFLSEEVFYLNKTAKSSESNS